MVGTRTKREGTTDAVRYFSRSFSLAGADGESLKRTEAELVLLLLLLMLSVVVFAETCRGSSTLPGTAVGWKGRLI